MPERIDAAPEQIARKVFNVPVTPEKKWRYLEDQPRRLDPSLIAPLRGKVRSDVGAFDVGMFRAQPNDSALRD